MVNMVFFCVILICHLFKDFLSLATTQFVATKTHCQYLGDITCPYYCTYLSVYGMYDLVCKPMYFLQQCDLLFIQPLELCDLLFIQPLELLKSFIVCETLQTHAYSTYLWQNV